MYYTMVLVCRDNAMILHDEQKEGLKSNAAGASERASERTFRLRFFAFLRDSTDQLSGTDVVLSECVCWLCVENCSHIQPPLCLRYETEQH